MGGVSVQRRRLVIAGEGSGRGESLLFTLAARGLEEHFSSCAVVSVFGSGGKYRRVRGIRTANVQKAETEYRKWPAGVVRFSV